MNVDFFSFADKVGIEITKLERTLKVKHRWIIFLVMEGISKKELSALKIESISKYLAKKHWKHWS